LLARWLGDDAQRPLAEAPMTDTVALSADDLAARFVHHPEIAVLERREQVAQAEAELARANQRSDWSVGLSYARRGSAYSDFISLSVSVPLQWDSKNRQDRELAGKLAVVEQLRAERGDVTAHTWPTPWRCCKSGKAIGGACSVTTARSRRWRPSAHAPRWRPTRWQRGAHAGARSAPRRDRHAHSNNSSWPSTPIGSGPSSPI